MNFIRQYEFKMITLEDLINELWDFGPNAITEIGEQCFQFYIDRACGYHELDYYVEEWNNDGINERYS